MIADGAKVHDFKERLAFSEAASEEPFWEAVYRKAFPSVQVIAPVHADCELQRKGVDRVLTLDNGRTLYVDEKKRSGEWDDVLLEYVSNDSTGAPGWIAKPLMIDYLAYAFMPTRRCLLLPWYPLQRAWLLHKEQWLGQYRAVHAQNPGYRTLCLPVPIPVLMKAVVRALAVEV